MPTPAAASARSHRARRLPPARTPRRWALAAACLIVTAAGFAAPEVPADKAASFQALQAFMALYTRSAYETPVRLLIPDLGPDAVDAVCGLIVDREIERARIANYTALPPAEKRAAIAQADEGFQTRLAALLTPDQAARIARLEKDMANLKIINNANLRLLYAGGPVTADQCQRLLQTMARWPSRELRLDAAGAAMSELIAARAEDQKHILDEAGAYLQPAQLREFAREFATEIAYLRYVQSKRDELKAGGGMPAPASGPAPGGVSRSP